MMEMHICSDCKWQQRIYFLIIIMYVYKLLLVLQEVTLRGMHCVTLVEAYLIPWRQLISYALSVLWSECRERVLCQIRLKQFHHCAC